MDKHNLHILKTETKKSNTNLKQEPELKLYRRVSSSCFTIDTDRVIQSKNSQY